MNLTREIPVLYCADGETALLRMAPNADLKLALERVSALVTSAYRQIALHDPQQLAQAIWARGQSSSSTTLSMFAVRLMRCSKFRRAR